MVFLPHICVYSASLYLYLLQIFFKVIGNLEFLNGENRVEYLFLFHFLVCVHHMVPSGCLWVSFHTVVVTQSVQSVRVQKICLL